MSREYRPSGDGLATLLAGRVDVLERRLTQAGDDVTALGRGVADLTAQIRHLTTTITGTTPNDTDTDTDPDPDIPEDEEEAEEGQPDWFTVTDPDEATRILTSLSAWVQDVGTHHGITLPVPCWGLHADVVADLLALTSERDSAYTSPHPTSVSEWLTRWAPATAARISTALSECLDQRGHRENGTTYQTTGFDPYSAGPWWAIDRTTPAPTAFALPALT